MNGVPRLQGQRQGPAGQIAGSLMRYAAPVRRRANTILQDPMGRAANTEDSGVVAPLAMMQAAEGKRLRLHPRQDQADDQPAKEARGRSPSRVYTVRCLEQSMDRLMILR